MFARLIGTYRRPSAEVLKNIKEAKTLFRFDPEQVESAMRASREKTYGKNSPKLKETEGVAKRVREKQEAGEIISLRLSDGKGLWRTELSKNMNEIRFVYDPSKPESLPLRNFVHENYDDLKYHNPKLPILVREYHGVEPTMTARYDFACELEIPVTDFSKRMLWESLYALNARGKVQGERSAESAPPTNYIVNRPFIADPIANPPISS
eukprot:c17524_g1_i1.p1 GENE.c17524_g1_i1~~c17524_g1_i1.p1  ORF type:complete len:221 (+),score=76.40 c17524_g1_i1:38-664(+)